MQQSSAPHESTGGLALACSCSAPIQAPCQLPAQDRQATRARRRSGVRAVHRQGQRMHLIRNCCRIGSACRRRPPRDTATVRTQAQCALRNVESPAPEDPPCAALCTRLYALASSGADSSADSYTGPTVWITCLAGKLKPLHTSTHGQGLSSFVRASARSTDAGFWPG